MEKYQIKLQENIIEYELNYKAIRSLYLKVEQGKLIVKAPMSMSKKTIEQYIIKYQDKILKQIQTYTPYLLPNENGYVDIFETRYKLVVRDVGKKQCAIHKDCVYVYDQDIEKCLNIYLKQILLSYIEERVIYYLANHFNLNMPKIVIKKYKGRWGSCFYKDNTISFHQGLVHLNKDLIDYVIVHELTHFLQPNHSPLFYQEMAKVMPDYQRRQKILKEKHV